MKYLKHFNDLNENIVYHGSPYIFDDFSNSMVGSGEGASGFGYGFYFTVDIDDAKEYARKLEKKRGEARLYKVRIPEIEMFLNIDDDLENQSEYVKKCLLNIPDKYKIKILEPYDFDYLQFKNEIDIGIKNGEYDMSIGSEEYNVHLKDILNSEFMNIGNNFYSLLTEIFNGEYNASKLLYDNGIKGNIHKGFRILHYIVFKDDDIKIIKRSKI